MCNVESYRRLAALSTHRTKTHTDHDTAHGISKLVTAVMFAPLNNLNMGLCGLSLCISCSECTQQIITAIGARVHSTRPLLSKFVAVMSSVKMDSLTSDTHYPLGAHLCLCLFIAT